MHSEGPLISVIMPTRNRAAMSVRAIDSVLAQRYRHLELLVVDDASTDTTWQTLNERYGDDERVRLFRQAAQSGACAARNRAIEAARGELITDIDDDDEFLPNRLVQLQGAMSTRYSGVASGYLWNHGAVTTALFASHQEIALPALLDLNVLSHLLCETRKLREVGGFDESLAAFQDYDLWIRLVNRFGPALRLAEPTYRVNVGHGQQRISDSQKRLAAHRQLVAKHRHLMSPRNLNNQRFHERTLTNERFGLLVLATSLTDGLVRRKCRYALSRWLSGPRQMRLRWLKNGLAGLRGRY